MIAQPGLCFGQPYQMVKCMELLESSRFFGHRFVRTSVSRFGAILLLALSKPMGVHSDQVTYGYSEEPSIDEVRIYSSLEERKAAGRGSKFTEWLTVSGLLELEAGQRRDKVRNGFPERREDILKSTIQLGLEAAFSESLRAEVLLETEWDDGERSVLDEAFLALEDEFWGIEAGRIYLPFGKFSSHFVTGPLLEFGETRGTALVGSYSLTERADLSLFIFDGESESRKKKSDALNWGVGFNLVSEHRAVRAGAAFLADLVDAADVSRLEFANSGRNRVGGLSAYVLLGKGSMELSAEIIHSIREFAAFEENINRPTAWNFELAYALRPALLLALRIEGSNELAEEPEKQAGISATWRLNKFASVSLEYLVGRYRDGFVVDDGGNALSMRRQFGIQIAAEF